MRLIKSIRFKYFLCLLAVSVLPVLFFFAYTLQANKKFYNNQVETASRTEVSRITSRINENYQDTQELVGSLLFSTYDGVNCITSICKQEAEGNEVTPSNRLKNYRMFKYVCTNLLENASFATGVYLFCENGHVYSYMKNQDYGIEKHYQEDEWYQNLINSTDSVEIADTGVYLFCENGHVYSYMKNQDYGIEKHYQEDEWYQNLINSTDSVEIAEMVKLRKKVYGHGDSCFLTARKFQTLKGDGGGVLAVVCKDTFFDGVSRGENLPWGSSLIINGKGNLVYGIDEGNLLSEDQVYKINENAEGILHMKGDKTEAFVYGSLDINDWKVVSKISFDSFYELYMQNSCVLYCIIALILIIVLVIAFWMERHSIRPIVRLSKVMETTTKQGLIFHNEYPKRKDEIGILYAYYEKMLVQINHLIEDKYQNEIKILKSRLTNLTSQINSHFIFNTLENISSLAQIEGNKQIVTMSKALGDMLRYSMDFEGDLIRLEKEIGHLKQYLNIQEVRFGNKIQLNLDLEKGTEKRKVMRFMLQPIVENAIEHGMAGKEFPWEIRIHTYGKDGELFIEVMDNGVGMNGEMLEKVRKRIYEPQKVEEDLRCFNIGLVNIHERLQLIFSKEYGLSIESKPEEGTKVTLHIPWI